MPDWITAISVGIGLVIGWILKQYQVAATISELKQKTLKLQAEITTEVGKHLREVQLKRKEYAEATISLRSEIHNLSRSVRDHGWESSEFRNTWLTCCEQLTEHVVPKFRDYCEWVEIAFKSEPDRLDTFVVREMIPEIKEYSHWMGSALNHPKVLEFSGQSGAYLSRSTLSPFSSLLDKVKPENIAGVSESFDSSVRILTHHQPQH